MSRAPNDHGFSLVESMVALAVFAMAGVGLMSLQAHSLKTLREAETRTLAGIVVENALVDAVAARAAPDLGERTGEVDLAGRRWRWRAVTEATADPLMRRVRVDAFEGDDPAPMAHAQAFVAKPS